MSNTYTWLNSDGEQCEATLEGKPMGEPCVECSARVPAGFIFGTTIYHPGGRPCHAKH